MEEHFKQLLIEEQKESSKLVITMAERDCSNNLFTVQITKLKSEKEKLDTANLKLHHKVAK